MTCGTAELPRRVAKAGKIAAAKATGHSAFTGPRFPVNGKLLSITFAAALRSISLLLLLPLPPAVPNSRPVAPAEFLAASCVPREPGTQDSPG
jgi:hypothetical protein